MLLVRVLAVVSVAATLAACSPASTRFGADDTSPPKSLVESSPLPPPAEAPAAAAQPSAPVTAPSADTWRPYAATKARGGRWSGSTAWKYPPQQRSEIAPKVQPTVQTAVVAASTSDRRWAEKWVTPGDQPAFEAAIKTSMTGGEGRWTTDNGMFGTAFPAARVGKCATIELMISPAQGGLPILNRGSIVQCT